MCFAHAVFVTLQLNVLTHEVISDHSTTALSPWLVHWQWCWGPPCHLPVRTQSI